MLWKDIPEARPQLAVPQKGASTVTWAQGFIHSLNCCTQAKGEAAYSVDETALTCWVSPRFHSRPGKSLQPQEQFC